ncbi:MAG: hypothetical protein LBQ12_08100 [Deltaproteobacteria bacterium]|nr:hypothetical protein [Deltaproteobacteria bacterium]
MDAYDVVILVGLILFVIVVGYYNIRLFYCVAKNKYIFHQVSCTNFSSGHLISFRRLASGGTA